jgi:hypothetical protein
MANSSMGRNNDDKEALAGGCLRYQDLDVRIGIKASPRKVRVSGGGLPSKAKTGD